MTYVAKRRVTKWKKLVNTSFWMMAIWPVFGVFFFWCVLYGWRLAVWQIKHGIFRRWWTWFVKVRCPQKKYNSRFHQNIMPAFFRLINGVVHGHFCLHVSAWLPGRHDIQFLEVSIAVCWLETSEWIFFLLNRFTSPLLVVIFSVVEEKPMNKTFIVGCSPLCFFDLRFCNY